MYSNREDAINIGVGGVDPVQCQETGLIYNRGFEPAC